MPQLGIRWRPLGAPGRVNGSHAGVDNISSPSPALALPLTLTNEYRERPGA